VRYDEKGTSQAVYGKAAGLKPRKSKCEELHGGEAPDDANPDDEFQVPSYDRPETSVAAHEAFIHGPDQLCPSVYPSPAPSAPEHSTSCIRGANPRKWRKLSMIQP
jgi:hypothetical protein